MTNSLALALAVAIAALVAADLWLDWQGHVAVGRRLDALVAWLAFWR